MQKKNIFINAVLPEWQAWLRGRCAEMTDFRGQADHSLPEAQKGGET